MNNTDVYSYSRSNKIIVLFFSHVCLLLKRGTIAHLHSVDEMGKVSNHEMVLSCKCLYCGFVKYC